VLLQLHSKDLGLVQLLQEVQQQTQLPGRLLLLPQQLAAIQIKQWFQQHHKLLHHSWISKSG
jgi:hypothetical protein